MKSKTLNREAVIRNINGLSEGDKAYCGPYGTITCTRKAAYVDGVRRRNSRRFTVANSSKIRNGGNHTIKSLRKAICL